MVVPDRAVLQLLATSLLGIRVEGFYNLMGVLLIALIAQGYPPMTHHNAVVRPQLYFFGMHYTGKLGRRG